jgi:hypothetical protein
MLSPFARLIVLFAVVANLVIGVPLQAIAHVAPVPTTRHVAAAEHGEHHAPSHEHHLMAAEQCAAMHPSHLDGDAAGDCTCSMGLCAAVLAILPAPATLVWDASVPVIVPAGVSLAPNTIHPPLRPPRV